MLAKDGDEKEMGMRILIAVVVAGLWLAPGVRAATTTEGLTAAERMRLTKVRQETGEVAKKAKKLEEEISKTLRKSNSERKRFGLDKVDIKLPELKIDTGSLRRSGERDWELREAEAKLAAYKQHLSALEQAQKEAEAAGEIDMSKVKVTPDVLKELLKDKGGGERLERVVDTFRKLPPESLQKDGGDAVQEREAALKKFSDQRLQGDCEVQSVADAEIVAVFERKDPGQEAEKGYLCTLRIKTFKEMAADLGAGDTIHFDGVVSAIQHTAEGLALTFGQACLVKRVRQAKPELPVPEGGEAKPEAKQE